MGVFVLCSPVRLFGRIMSKHDVSLAAELALLRQALAAAAQLLEPCTVGEELPPEAGQELLAVITLAEARVELLRRTVVGAVDPALLRGRHNDVLEPRRKGDDPDVILRGRRVRESK